MSKGVPRIILDMDPLKFGFQLMYPSSFGALRLPPPLSSGISEQSPRRYYMLEFVVRCLVVGVGVVVEVAVGL